MKKKRKEKLLTVAEAAKYLRVSRQAVNDAVLTKRLRSKRRTIKKVVVKKLEITLIDKADLDNFVVSRSQQEKGRLRKS